MSSAITLDERELLVEHQLRCATDSLALGLGVGQSERTPSGPEAEEAALLSECLLDFVRGAWHVLEPVVTFRDNWHLQAVAEHLEAVARFEIRRLVINVPPGTMKSLMACVFWPAWVWTHAPHLRWLFSSYGQALSTRDSLRSRRLIQSPWYQARWGHLYQLTSDQNVKTRFENSRTGYRIATSVEGSGTGERADVVVVDDPHNVRQAASDLQRQVALDWWDLTMSTRFNDPQRGSRVIIMQRVHEQDLTGHVLGREAGYVHLKIPMRLNPDKRCVTVLGWEDPRRAAGQLMWPEHFPEQEVKELEADLGPYGTAGQLQQEPTARSGGQFERAWFEIVPTEPHGKDILRVRFWDKAGTAGGGKFTVGTLMSYRPKDGVVFVEDVVRGQWAAGDRERIILETAQMDATHFGSGSNGETRPDPLAVLNVVEQEPGSGGKDSAQATVRNLAGYRVEAETASGDKFVRADPLAGAAKVGDVRLVQGRWNRAWLDELEAAGPGATYLDQMDSASGAYNRLMRLAHKQAAPVVGINLGGLVRGNPWDIR